MSKKIFGGDFEFHFNHKSDGHIICAESVLTMSKKVPIAAETTTAEIRPSATNNVDQFIAECRDMLYTLYKENNDLSLVCSPVNKIDIANLRYYVTTNSTVGCKDEDKQINFYDQIYLPILNRTLILPDNHRTQGGHFWLEPSDPKRVEQLIKLLDLLVGLPSVILFPGEKEAERRVKYGKAGNYRTRDGLVEYRVLSSSVMKHPEILRNFLLMIDWVNCNFTAIWGWTTKKEVREVINKTYEVLPLIINTNWTHRAFSCWNDLIALLSSNYACFPNKQIFTQWDLFIRYMSTSSRDRPSNFLENWFIS
jgi:hypothetical protein